MKRGFLFTLSCLLFAGPAVADTTDFGGYTERFHGAGDKIPPRCQIDIPTASTEAFFVKWNCSDDNAAAEEIRTELWLYRNGSSAGELIANFLGFPASVKIDEALLRVASFRDGLPLSVKLLARDKAGITTISPLLTVRAQDNSLTSCGLNVTTDGTESTGSTTGTPSLAVAVTDVRVNVTQSGETQLAVSSAGSALADVCEINSLCLNDDRVTFASSLSFTDSFGAVKGSLSIQPGGQLLTVEGTSSANGASLENLNVSGETTVDGQNARVSLTCNR